MQQTLLEMVQLILSSMDSDEVNSISDTVESNQVALIIKSVYYDSAVDLNLREHEKLFELNASGDLLQPTLMTVPTDVTNVTSIKYNFKEDTDTFDRYEEVKYLPFDEFLSRQNSLAENDNVGQMIFSSNGESFPILYSNDKFPQYYTTVSNYSILFDSYNSTVDSTLQKEKTMCKGLVYPTFQMTDNFVPDLAPSQFPYLINKAKVRAFVELKQTNNAEAASEVREQRIKIQKRKRRVFEGTEFDKIPKYGRK